MNEQNEKNLAKKMMKLKQIIALPSTPFGSAIARPFSRRHTICGGGDPVAAHLNVTFEPSRTTMSVLVG